MLKYKNEHEVERGDSFKTAKTRTQTLQHAETGRVKYDLIGKVAEGTTLTRKTVAKILSGLRADKIYMLKHNPEEFISKQRFPVQRNSLTRFLPAM